ncbi:MAG: serine hydrolase domain-containing protein [Gammaproteobacteria bacterium]
MKKLLALLVFTGFAAGARADAIDDYINTEIARQHAPGLAIAIMQHGQMVRAQGYGFANLEHYVPVHPDTLFETGSVGMQFTALAVMLLVEDGKLRLDESIRKYLPEAPRTWAPITVRQLLNHTSGLPATPNGEFRTDYTDDQLLGILYKQELNFAAGSHWKFSYTDYVTLGFLIKRVSGEFYADLLARRVFAPLGMRTARLIDDRAIVPNRAAGYQLSDGELRNQEWVSPTANSTADGSLYLSVLDYARWDAGLIGRRFLKPESWAEIAQPARLASGRSYPYGFGWFLEHSAGQEVWRHSGSWQGFQSFVIRYLGDELTLVALANSESGDPTAIVRHVAGMLDPKFAQPPGAPIEDREPQVTAALKSLLQQMSEGKADYRAFAFVSKQEFAETMSANQKLLKSLGPLRELALFARKELGGDQVYRYRARYEGGLLEVNLSYAPNGGIAGLDFIPVSDWKAPVQE